MRTSLLSLLFGVGMATLGHATPIVLDTSGSTGNSTGTGQPFGNFGTPDQNRLSTIGETFIAPVGAATFQSIAFDLRVVGQTPGPQLVDAYFLAWDNGLDRPTGAVLGSVTGLVIPGLIPGAFERVTANFGSIAVTSGQMYVAYFTTLTSSGAYPGVLNYEFDANFQGPGQFGGEVVFNLNNSFANLTDGSNTWNGPFGGPLSFMATFETPVVPELSTRGAAVPLCWVALALLATGRRRNA